MASGESGMWHDIIYENDDGCLLLLKYSTLTTIADI